MGPGYELWADTAKDAVNNFNDISSILDKIDDDEHPEWIKQYLDPNRNNKSLPLAKANGPFGSMTIVQTSDYPAEALSIKKFFCPAPVAPSAAIFPTGNVMLSNYRATLTRKLRQRRALSSSCFSTYKEMSTSRPHRSRVSLLPSLRKACKSS
jgi:hypothetical protein